MADYRVRGGQNHLYAASSSNNKQAQLVNAYQDLGRELGSEKLTIVGGYTLGRVIGEGTYGSVHLAVHRLTGTRCAIKKIPKSQTPSLTREIHHHRRLHHPSIVQLYEIIATETHIWLVTELCSGGELFDYLVEKKRFQEGEARRLFGELVVAVGYLHRQGVVHRDLKLENILLDGHLKVKLGDLGFAREFRRGQLMETFCGTIGYASPEMLGGQKYLGEETDIWSLGIILYTLLCGGMPFDDDDEVLMKKMILKAEYEEPDWISDESKSLIRGLLKVEPSERLSIDGILAHDWFKKVIRDRPDGFHESDSFHTPQLAPQSSFDNTHAEASTSTSSTLTQTPIAMPQPSQSTSLSDPLTHLAKAPPSSTSSEASQDLTDSEHGPPASDSTAPTTVEDDDLSKSLPRTHSGEFSQTEQMLELLHPNISQSTIKKPEVSSTVKAKVAMPSSLEGQQEEEDEDVDNGHDRSPGPLPVRPNSITNTHIAALQHTRTPSRTKRRSVSSSLSMERRASYMSSSGDFDVQPIQDYAKVLLEERPPLFSTARERHLLTSCRVLGIDTEQLRHSVTSNACDTSAAMWWILLARDQEMRDAHPMSLQGETPRPGSQQGKRPIPLATEMRPSQSKEDSAYATDTMSQSTARGPGSMSQQGGNKTPPTEEASGAGSPKTATPPPNSPFRGIKSRSPSMSMLQRATSAFTGSGKKNEEKEREAEEGERRGDGSRSPTKLHKLPPKGKAVAKSEISSPASAIPLASPSGSGIGEGAPKSRFLEEGSTGIATQPKGAKKESLWNQFRDLFNEDRRRRKDPNARSGGSGLGATIVLSRGPVARQTPGPHRTPQAAAISRRTSLDGGRPPLHSRRSSSINSRRSSFNSGMMPAEHREALNALTRRISHRSHGSQTPTSEQEIEFPPVRPESAHSFGKPGGPRHQSLRSPSLQSDSSGRLHGPAPASPLHDYHRRPPSGSSSSRIRHIRVIPDATIHRSGSVASSIRSTASSRASSIDKKWLDGGDDTSVSSKRSGKSRKRASPKPNSRSHHSKALTRAARNVVSKAPLRDVFEDKDGEWVDEDEHGHERREFAGGVGQSSTSGDLKYKDSSRAASHPGNWNGGHKRHHRHHGHGHTHGQSRSRKNSLDESSSQSESIASDSQAAPVGGIKTNSSFPHSNHGRRQVLPAGRSRQPVVIEEEEDEET